MMWLLLFVLTGLVVLLPMLPAIGEWRRPTDLEPLYIDSRDALDPPFLARSFATSVIAAVGAGQAQLGALRIAVLGPSGAWPLEPEERRSATSQRVWYAASDMVVPARVSFVGGLVAAGAVNGAAGGTYRGLWAGGELRLSPRSTITHWAHGARVEVAANCRLAGRVSADECIEVACPNSFTLLHASTVRFGATLPAGGSSAPAQGFVHFKLPANVVWDAGAARGTCVDSLDVDDHTTWRGDLVLQGDLWLGTGCRAVGSLKAHGIIVADTGCTVDGNIVAEGGIALGEGCSVRGSVISETAIVLSAGCVIGAPGHPATVSAPRIEVGAGVTVYGTVWASEQGNVLAGAVASAAADGSEHSRRSAFAPGVAA